MTQEEEGQITQHQSEGEAPQAEEISQEELADLKKRAEVSSQNFERAKKAEQEKKELQRQLEEAQLGQDSFASDDETAKKLKDLEDRFIRIEEQRQLDAVYTQFPAIKDNTTEFNEFREQYAGIEVGKVAKLFLVEKDLIEDVPKRKGLEKAGGGQRSTPKQTPNVEDVKRLRENNFREYMKQNRAGKINV